MATLYLETNFLMAIATGRWSVGALLDNGPSRVAVSLPAACVTEAFAALEYEQNKARQLSNTLDDHIRFVRNAGRSETHAALLRQLEGAKPLIAKFGNELRARLSSALVPLLARVRLLPDSAAQFADSAADATLSPTDGLILRIILDDAPSQSGPLALFTEDAHFREPSAMKRMEAAGVSLLSQLARVQEWLASPALCD